jgi:D-alanyl-D-alanine carboxypeptidase
MVLDVTTGRVLHAVNEDELRYPASVTKIMTLYLLFEQLDRGNLTLDTPLRVSANAARQAPSKLGLAPGSTISVEDAIKALVTKSANDIAVTVAENLAGSEDDFAEEMTRKARALGMNRTVYRNASGLPNREQVTTARDLTVLARAVQDRFPKYYRYFQTRIFNFAGASHRNHNKLLGRIEGLDGIKTGFTNASGFNLVTNVKTADRHIVGVVLGGRSARSRDQAMASLIETNLPRAYAGTRNVPTVAEAPAPVPRPVVVADAVRPPQAAAPRQLQPDLNVETTASAGAPFAVASALPTATPVARKPLDLNSLRPVVASAAGASSTTTPSSPLRWQTGPQALPQTVQAYAPVKVETAPRPVPAPTPVAPIAVGKSELKSELKAEAKNEDRLPAGTFTVAKGEVPDLKREAAGKRPEMKAEAKSEDRLSASIIVAAKAEVPDAKRETAVKPAAAGWMIQLGATDEESKAKVILDNAKSRSGRALSRASAFTEKVTREGTTLYRARFSGFQEADDAQQACKVLKRSGFACFATRG